ncbi:hypothetical protein [Halomonas sp. BC2]|uniref:hypothetical protein n=1 Tax=Halomonas sp. BC2 TaxID=1670449 RepID=UPI0009C0251E|nr:hypothetical protein [Halomonas sp. BC2]
MNTTTLQKNINKLAVPTQECLAKKIDIPGIDQRYISYVVCGQKSFSNKITREIEKRLLIPAGWLDRYLFNYKTIPLLNKYRSLDEKSRLLFDELSLHMIENEKS